MALQEQAPKKIPHSLVLICPLHTPTPLCLSARPWSCMATRCPRPFPHRALVGCHAVPYHHAPIPDTCATHSLASVRPSPIAIAHTADPAMATRAHVSWHLKSSSVEPRALMSTGVLVVLVRCRSPPALTPTARINWPRLPLPYIAIVCFRCFKGMLQLFLMDVAKVDQGMLHMLQVFQKHVASVCSKCFIRFQTYVAIVFN
jgi:hypothetical protein